MKHTGPMPELSHANVCAACARDLDTSKERRPAIPFDSVEPVKPGEKVIILTRPYIQFRWQRFVIPADLAPFFLVNRLRLGSLDLIPSPEPLHGTAFKIGEDAVKIGQVAAIGMDMFAEVTNISTEPRRFMAYALGGEPPYDTTPTGGRRVK